MTWVGSGFGLVLPFCRALYSTIDWREANLVKHSQDSAEDQFPDPVVTQNEL